MMMEEADQERPERDQRLDNRDFGRRALSYLDRARKTRARKGWEADPEADFLLASASVLATLELASAIREAAGSVPARSGESAEDR
jgi:hypothetical protein